MNREECDRTKYNDNKNEDYNDDDTERNAADDNVDSIPSEK